MNCEQAGDFFDRVGAVDLDPTVVGVTSSHDGLSAAGYAVLAHSLARAYSAPTNGPH